MTRKSVTLVHDPSGLYSSGASFNMEDIRRGVYDGSEPDDEWTPPGQWADGTEFRLVGRRGKPDRNVVIVAQVAVDADTGEAYKPKSCGAEWWTWE